MNICEIQTFQMICLPYNRKFLQNLKGEDKYDIFVLTIIH